MGDSFQVPRDLLAMADPENDRTVVKIEMGEWTDGKMHVVMHFNDGSDVICRQDPDTGLFAMVQMRHGKWASDVEGMMDVQEMIRLFLTPGEKLKVSVIPPDRIK